MADDDISVRFGAETEGLSVAWWAKKAPGGARGKSRDFTVNT
jgi:hypothetical protein